MAPGRRRGAKGAKTKSELSLGDLVLAKVKGFPAWPAKISKPEDWERTPDPKKYFVQFFGTSEIAFVAPADIQAFTNEAKSKLCARCQGKKVKHFARAVKEICEEFDRKTLSGVSDHNSAHTLASQTRSLDPVVVGNLEVSENKGLMDMGSGLERCTQRQGETECQDINPCSSDNVKRSLSPHSSLGKKNKLSANSSNLVKDSVPSSSPSHYSLLQEEDSSDIKAEGRFSDAGEKKVTNGQHSKSLSGSKKKREGAAQRNSDSAFSHQHTGDGIQKKFASSGGSSRSGLNVGIERKEKNVLKGKKHSGAVNDDRMGAEEDSEEHDKVISGKKMKSQHDREKLFFRKNEASCPSKMSKGGDGGDDARMFKAQPSRKNGSRGSVVLDGKLMDIESKNFTLGGKTEARRPLRVQAIADGSHSTDEDDLPPSKRHRQALETMSSSALISENRLGSSLSRKSDLVSPNKVRSPVMQLQTKRRAVRLCVDDDDELPKTPIHGGFTNKVSVLPSVSDSKRKPVTHSDSDAQNHLTSRSSGIVNDCLKQQTHSAQASTKVLSPSAQGRMMTRAGELSAAHASPNEQQLDSENLLSGDAKPVSPRTSPQPITGPGLSAEPQYKHACDSPGVISQKKVPAGANKGLITTSDTSVSSVNLSVSDRSKPASAGDKRKTTPKSDSGVDDPLIVVGSRDNNIIMQVERMAVIRDARKSFAIDSKPPESVTSMKHLIAAAQARKRQAHLQSSSGNPLSLLIPDAEVSGLSPSPTPATLAFESTNTFQLDVQGFRPTSPSSDLRQISFVNQQENEELEERRVSSGHQATGSSLSGGTEAAVARDAFEGMIETLSRTKESIGRATRLAIDCAKYGIANEVVELLIQKLENEPSFHRRVDLFFLVDSITQCSHSQKGIAGASYIPTVEAALPRLIGAAAPLGTGAQENRRQCHKVLRLWLERKILPESVLRRYMDDIGVVNDDTSAVFSLRRPSRAERAFDDPIREMEGMLVDEYGSNVTFQLPGLLSSHIFEEEEDEDDFPNTCKDVADASPSKHTPIGSRDTENYTVTPSDRRHCILEDVDGELEMEDVSGHQKDERAFFTNGTSQLASFEPNSDGILEYSSKMHSEWLPSPDRTPPLPLGSPPATPPLPDSPPPSSPPPPPLSSPSPPPPPPPHSSQQHLIPPPTFGPPPPGPPPPVGPSPLPVFPPQPAGPPPLLSQQSLTNQPAFMSQQMPPLSSSISPPSAYQQPALPSEICGKSTGSQHANMVPNTHGSHVDTSVSQQSSCFAPAGVNNRHEKIGYNSSRPVEYGPGDANMNAQAFEHRQPFPAVNGPFAQRPLGPEHPPQHPPSHFSYPNSAQQHQYPAYSIPTYPDGLRRYATDEQWRMPINDFNKDGPQGGWMPGGRSCSGPPYPHEGYFGPLPDRPPAKAINFQPSAPNALPASTPIPVHGVPMMPSRPDMSAGNWRPPI